LATPGRSGQSHKDGPIRQFLPSYSHIFLEELLPYGEGWLDQYREKWDILSLESVSDDAEGEMFPKRGRVFRSGRRVIHRTRCARNVRYHLDL
jgi:hypothetical protein